MAISEFDQPVELLEAGVERPEPGMRAAFRGQPRRQPLQHAADLDGVEDVLLREGPYGKAAGRNGLDQPLLLQPLQRGADRACAKCRCARQPTARKCAFRARARLRGSARGSTAGAPRLPGLAAVADVAQRGKCRHAGHDSLIECRLYTISCGAGSRVKASLAMAATRRGRHIGASLQLAAPSPGSQSKTPPRQFGPWLASTLVYIPLR